MFVKRAKSNLLVPSYLAQPDERIIKLASNVRIPFDPTLAYCLDDWAVSAYEVYGLNENADGFEREELKHSYGSFVGSWVCLDHNNDHAGLSVGENIDAIYTPDDYVRVLMCVDRAKSEKRHPGLEQKIASGAITDSSMGCVARISVCCIPKCANVATDESQFCDHVTKLRGQILCNAQTNWRQIKAGELNRGVFFFENTIITAMEGADRNAKFIDHFGIKAAMSGLVTLDPNKLYQTFKQFSKTATLEEQAMLTLLLERVMEG